MHFVKSYQCCLLFMLTISIGWGQEITPTNQNYLMHVSAQEAFSTVTEFESAPIEEKITSMTYYDGLGRAMQQIAVGASPLTSRGSTNLAVMDWTIGDGGTSFFNQNGDTSENQRIHGLDPTGRESLLWQCGNDIANDADGGWNTDYFHIDNTSGYQYSVWVKRTGSNNGNTYHGTQNVNTLDGEQDTNPYFFVGDLPELNTWYLLVGMIHPHDYTGEDLGISGVYDVEGNRVLDGKEFKWREDEYLSSFRSYLFYSTDINVRQYFWNPMIQRLDGTEQQVTGINVFNTTNELTMDWTSGSGSTAFFNQNGQTSENKREYGDNPHGLYTILWKCGNDADNNADGGWNTDYINVDKTLEYRYSVWVKRTGSQNGKTYHGTHNVEDLNGVAQTNPYFWNGDLPKLDTWYQLKGIIHPEGYSGGDQGFSGVYDIYGNKVMDGQEFRWSASTTTAAFRSYLYYSTDTTVRQFFWNPVVQKMGGTVNPDAVPVLDETSLSSDIITHIEYDSYGRQAKQFLPFTSTGPLGSYREVNKNYNINAYYQNKYVDDFENVLLQDVNAYAQNVFEYSPLNRVVEQGAPGVAWKAQNTDATSHTIKYEWKTNQLNEVKRYRITFDNGNIEKPLLADKGYYAANELFVTITKDENWSPDQPYPLDHTTRAYKDKLGRVVLKQTFNQGVAHDTYYVYDDFGNLTFVLPPKVTVANGVSQSELAELCYQYRYDYRNRLVEKKIPGKGWEYIIYNKLDQPIITQDALLQTKGVWLFTKYDTMGRIAYTGKIDDNRDRNTIQAEVNNTPAIAWVEKGLTTTNEGVTINYTNGGYPNSENAEILTVNYYDDYNFDTEGLVKPGTVSGEALTNRTRSLPTGSKVRVLDTNDWITTLTGYDKKGRVIYVASQNKHLDTKDIEETQLDFAGRVVQNKTTHIKGSNAPIVIQDAFTYDQVGRLLTQTQKINDQDAELIVNNTYDELGQLVSKKVGGLPSTEVTRSAGLQTVGYTYNIRGWLKAINDPNNLGDDLFAFGINYNTPTDNLYAQPLYNGNISETIWRTANDNTKRAYGYHYDALNRLTTANNSDSDNFDVSNITYDKMGNILTLNRKGHLNANATSFGDMDNLSYSYDNGNKLLKVTDTANKNFGFKDGTNTNDDYSYDINGNLLVDHNKNVSGIVYNYLNLPTRVNVNAGHQYVRYIYDATGAKQKKIVTKDSGRIITEYAGKYIYENGNLRQFSHVEGYVEPDDNGDFNYVYSFLDHLGTIRLTYSDFNDNGLIESSTEILQERNVYPFGLEHRGYNNIQNGVKNNYQTYLGQEMNEELGLNWLTFRYRNYIPEIGRFFGVDPISEDYMSITNYQFAHNNPVWKIELEGLEGVSTTIPDVINKEQIKRSQFIKPNYKKQGDVFGGSVTYSRKIGPAINVKASAGNTKASIDASILKVSITNSTDHKISVKGNILNAEVGFGLKGIGQSKTAVSVGQINETFTESGLEQEASLLAVDVKATVRDGFSVAESGALISSNEEKNGKFTGSYGVSDDTFSGTLKGNKLGFGASFGPVSASISTNIDELSNMFSNVANKIFDVIINGWNSNEDNLMQKE